MNKQELIEAIEGTLAPNGNKAITADALKALLLEVVDSIGEGGHGGGITLQVSLDDNGNLSVTPKQIAQNKKQLDILRQLHDKGEPTPPILIEAPSTMEGMTVSQMLMSVFYIIWDTTEVETPEMLPEGLILPAVILDEYTLNGDGTLLIMEQ